MKVNQLVEMFTKLQGTGSRLLFSDIMRAGFNGPIVKHAVEVVGGSYESTTEGYTVIVL